MKRNKYLLYLCIIFLITTWFSWNRISEASYYKTYFTSISIRTKNEGIKADRIAKALEQEEEAAKKSVVTFWRTIGEAEIQNTFLHRKEKVLAIMVWGDFKDTIPMKLLHGNYVYRDDYNGCIIDSKTAYSLFGTTKVVNNFVTYNNRNYSIRGVVKSSLPIFMIQEYSKAAQYPNLEFKYTNSDIASRKASEFITRYNLAEDYVSIDGYFFSKILHTFLILPIWLFYFTFSFFIVKNIMKRQERLSKSSLLLFLVGILTIVGYGFLLYELTGTPVSFPGNMIPTKWSDFQYWSNLSKSITEQIKELHYVQPNPRDLLLEKALLQLNLNCFVMGLLYLLLFLSMTRFLTENKN